MTAEPIRFVQLGLGPIGRGVARLAASAGTLRLVGAADADPSLAGRDAGEVLGLGALGIEVADSIDAVLERAGPELALHATGSSLERVAPEILACVARGASVVSTCEELSYPFYRHPELSREIDARARERGVVVLGVGVNPGFVLDKLVATLLAACTRVDRVRAVRVLDASTRRRPFIAKIGAGITAKEFERRRQAGLMGHVGLAESMHLVADVMGVPRERTVRERVAPKIADEDVVTDAVSVKRGRVLGVEQEAVLEAGGRKRVVMRLELYVGAERPRDEVVVEGSPGLEMVVPGGVPGDEGTAAATVSYALRLRDLAPGLRTVLDVPVRFDIRASGESAS